MEHELKSITVVIAGRPYPLKVAEGEEAAVRKAAKEINDRVDGFSLAYTDQDKQDCLSMAILTYAVELQKLQLAPAVPTPADLDARLSRLDARLGDLLP